MGVQGETQNGHGESYYVFCQACNEVVGGQRRFPCSFVPGTLGLLSRIEAESLRQQHFAKMHGNGDGILPEQVYVQPTMRHGTLET